MPQTSNTSYDSIVVGSGPNGLAAAITMARAGRSVLLIEGRETVGGGTRTHELTLPGFRHDLCSTVHPLALASPFFRSLPLAEFGLEFIQPPAALVHPFDDGSAAVLERSVADTAAGLNSDGPAYTRVMEPLVEDWEKILDDFLGPLPLPPAHPLIALRFGLNAVRSARGFARSQFQGRRARALFAGMAAHSILTLEKSISASFGLMLGMLGHAVGWPVVRSGSQQIANALADILRSLGGTIATGQMVQSIDALPPARSVLLDVTPRQFLQIAGHHLPPHYKRQLNRYRYGPGVFKIDYALDGPMPWKAVAGRRAATLHLGGTLEEVAAAERAVWQGKIPEKPFVLFAQQSLFDDQRAPQGKHTAWAYCHVPNGSTVDMTGRIEAQIERFAPGFRDCVLARSTRSPAQLEAYNPNYVGGDINGGVQDIWQLFTRPALHWLPYITPIDGVYLCSSSTPPGGGVHGMCGFHAARTALAREGA